MRKTPWVGDRPSQNLTYTENGKECGIHADLGFYLEWNSGSRIHFIKFDACRTVRRNIFL